jgi:hypothetical protein
MGAVIRFPDEKRMGWSPSPRVLTEPATVVILPVVRVERHADAQANVVAPEANSPRTGGRGRRSRRS